MFRKWTKTATVYRQSYTTSGGYEQSGFSATGNSYKWHLKAITLSSTVEGGASFGRDFRFHTDYNADIKESDKLTIDSVSYDVKWVANFDWITFKSKQCILTLADNAW